MSGRTSASCGRKARRKGTAIAVSQQDDLERGLLFQLAQRICTDAAGQSGSAGSKDNLEYYDRVLKISSDRYQAGDIAQIDLDRLELQRVQYESDVQTAIVNLRTAKIQMLIAVE